MADVFSIKKRSWVMSRIHGRDTSPEIQVRRVLHRMGFRFRVHRGDLPGVPDVVLPKFRVALFIHGCFWHGHDCKDGRRPKSNTEYWNRKLQRDAERDSKHQKRLRQRGWKPVIG